MGNNSDKSGADKQTLEQRVSSIDRLTVEALTALNKLNNEISALKYCITATSNQRVSIEEVETFQNTVTEFIKELQNSKEIIKGRIYPMYKGQPTKDRGAISKKLRTTEAVNVQLFMPKKDERLYFLLKELSEKLTACFEEKNMQLDGKMFEDPNEISSKQPLLVLCINASRLGSDVESALQGLNPSKNQVLIILHHKEIHALPSQPSELMLTSSNSTYKDLGGIIDMAFWMDRGIYECDMNDRALTELVKLIKQLSK